jgi:hypothetical protein
VMAIRRGVRLKPSCLATSRVDGIDIEAMSGRTNNHPDHPVDSFLIVLLKLYLRCGVVYAQVGTLSCCLPACPKIGCGPITPLYGLYPRADRL